MTPDIAAVRNLLQGVRALLRRSHLVRGAALVVAVVATLVVVSFFFDLLLDMPVAVRGVHLVLTVLGLVLFARWAFAPLGAKPSDEQIAEAVEHDVPEFEDRLVSSLDFERRIADPAEPESRQMMAAAVREASAIASRLDPRLLVDGRPARRAIVLAVAALAAVIASELTFPEEFRLWLRRGLLLEDVSWPRRTNILVLEFPESGPRVITRGEDLRIVAVAEGSQPADLDLHLEELSEAEDGASPEVTFRDVRKMFPVPDQPGRYAFDFRAVAASFRFWVTGGDDQDDRPKYEVKALIPPRVASFSARVVYPAYAGLAPAEVRDPVFDALVGSKVTFSFKANMPLTAARLVPSEGDTRDLTLAAGGREFTAEFDLQKTIEFHLELKAVAGNANRNEDDVFHVDAVSDRAPTVRMLHPRGRITATPQAIVPVKLIAEDDFGLAEATMKILQGTSAAGTVRLWTAPAEAPASAPRPATGANPAPPAVSGPQKSVHVFRALDMTSLQGDSGVQVKPGDVFTLQVRVKDVGGLEGEGAEVTVEVVSPEEMAQRLVGEMSRLRDDLLQSRRAQRKLVASLRELSETTAAAPADAAAFRRGRDLQVDQGRVTNELSRFLTGIERVFDAHVLDRMGSIPTIDRVLPIYLEFLAKEPDDQGDVFPSGLYTKILDEKRAGRLYDPEILGILLDVMEMSVRVRDLEAPAAYDALDRWTADGPHAPADLDAGVAGALKVQSSLDAIDERLQKFEDLAAIVQLATAIRDGVNQLTKKAPTTEPK